MKTILKRRPAAAKSEAAQKRATTLTGAVVLAFALIGVLTVISLLISLVASLFDNSKEKEYFKQFIKPVVMVDPVAFSSVSNADEHALLMSSMWNLLMNVGEDTAYPEDEYGMMIIPSSDLDVSAANLFGSEAKLSHQTFGNTSITFEYDSENSSYIVPPMGYTVQYEPRVEKIKRKGKMYTLTVAYISSNTTFTQTEGDEDYDKLMYYVLEKTGKDKYVIRSIADTEEQKENTSSLKAPDNTTSSGISQTESSSIAVPEK
ncbi:MAG: hypothetical protein UHH95_03515 [Oscillospiraceae bacterium]|nr:hypothetical protein [Oscillospiraceae bacterium]